MAQAQFIGGTPAENSRASIDQFMQGMGQLAQFGQFAAEQNRLKKIEEIKNKTSQFITTAKRFSPNGDSETLGIKRMAEEMPDYFKNQLKLIGYDDNMSSQIVDMLAGSEMSVAEQYGAELLSSMKIMTGEPVEPPAVQGVKAVQASYEGTSLNTPGPSQGQVPSASAPQEGEWFNLVLWDEAAAGKYGPEAQAAINNVIAPMNQKYKALGWTPEDQGSPGKPRPMYFTTGLAKSAMDKLKAEGSQGAGGAQQQPVQGGPAWARTAAGGAPVNDTAGAGGSSEKIMEIQNDLDAWNEAVATIDAARKKAAPNAPGFSNLTPEQQAAGPVHTNAHASEGERVVQTPSGTVTTAGQAASGATTTPGVDEKDRSFWAQMQTSGNMGPWQGMSYEEAKSTGALQKAKDANPNTYRAFEARWNANQAPATAQASGTTPAAPAPSSPSSPQQAIADAKTAATNNTSVQEKVTAAVNLTSVVSQKLTDQELRAAQVYSKKLQKVVTTQAMIELARSDPAGKKAFERWRAQDAAHQHLVGMAYDPAGENAFQRQVASGAWDAQLANMNADTQLKLAELAQMPKELAVRAAEAEARLQEARASMANSRNALEMSENSVLMSLNDLERSRLALEADQLAQSEGPVTEAYKAYNTAWTNYTNYVRSMAKAPDNESKVAQLNIYIDSINSAAAALNAAGIAARGSSWGTYSGLDNVELKTSGIWFIRWKPRIEAMKGTGATASAPTSAPAPAPAPGSNVDDEVSKWTN